MPERSLISIFPQRGSDKIFQKVPLTSVTVTNADTAVFGGYEKVVTVPHQYGKYPNVVMESSLDQVFWYPAPLGVKTYVPAFNLYMFVHAARWSTTENNIIFTFFANSSYVPLTIYYRSVVYANQ